MGVNALDAFVQAYNNISTLRQQLLPSDRIHTRISHGGEAANIIPAYTRSEWMIRATTKNRLEELVARSRACIEAAATATGCSVEITADNHPYVEMRTNQVIADIYMVNSEALGRPMRRFADLEDKSTGSSDMGNVSQVVPSLHPGIHVDSGGASNHHPGLPQPPSPRQVSRLSATVPSPWSGPSSTWPSSDSL